MIKIFKEDGTVSKTQVWNLIGIAAGAAMFALPEIQTAVNSALVESPALAGLVIAGIKMVDFFFRAITTQGVK